MYKLVLNAKTAHQMLEELEAKGFLISQPIPPPSAQAAWNRRNRGRKHRLKERSVIKRTYELTQLGKDLLFWWEAFIRSYEGPHVVIPEKPITIPEY